MVALIQAGFQIDILRFDWLRAQSYQHQFENLQVNLNFLNDKEYNSLTEIVSKLEREEKLLMMNVDEREKFFNDEIEELKAQEKAALEAAKQADQPLPTVKEETQLESQPEAGNKPASDATAPVPSNIQNVEPTTDVDEGNVDGQATSHEDNPAGGEAREEVQADSDQITTENVDEENEEKTVN